METLSQNIQSGENAKSTKIASKLMKYEVKVSGGTTFFLPTSRIPIIIRQGYILNKRFNGYNFDWKSD